MLGHRRRRWPNIESTLGQFIALAEKFPFFWPENSESWSLYNISDSDVCGANVGPTVISMGLLCQMLGIGYSGHCGLWKALITKENRIRFYFPCSHQGGYIDITSVFSQQIATDQALVYPFSAGTDLQTSASDVYRSCGSCRSCGGEPPWPRGSVLGLRPPGLEFRILCLEDSVISIISPSSGGSPGPV